MNRDLNQTECDHLEALVDSCSIGSVLIVLTEICIAKGEHVESNWQDKPLARRWNKLGDAIDAVASKADGL